MIKPTINKNTGLDYTIFRDIYNRLENAAQLDVSGNLTVCGDLLVKQCLNVENIVYDTETIYMSGKTISGSKSLSWIDTSGSGVLEDGVKDGFYKKIVKICKCERLMEVDEKILNADTSGEWIVPDDISTITVEAYGGGGGGGYASTRLDGGGGGGGGGAYIKKTYNVSSGQIFSYSVGSGGSGGSYPFINEGNGNDGGNTTWAFGLTTISANGGSGGKGEDQDGGSGGISMGGDINIDGKNGIRGTGLCPDPDPSIGGNGGNGVGPLGGDGGDGGDPSSILNGSNGTIYGAGGGGGGSNNCDRPYGRGGNGSDGVIIITCFSDIPEPYTITYNTTETTVLTDKGDNACFIYNEDLGEWIKLNE